MEELEFNGKKITYSEYKIIIRRFIEKKAHSIKELRSLWMDDSKRRQFMDMLYEMQMDINFIKETENTEDSDTFDVIANMVFESPLITRKERVKRYIEAYKDDINKYGSDVSFVILEILKRYEKGGIENIDMRILLNEDMIQNDAYNILKSNMGSQNVAELFRKIKREIYNI